MGAPGESFGRLFITFSARLGFCWMPLTLKRKPTFSGLGGSRSALVRPFFVVWISGYVFVRFLRVFLFFRRTRLVEVTPTGPRGCPLCAQMLPKARPGTSKNRRKTDSVASGGARALPGGLGVPPRLENVLNNHLFYKTLYETWDKNLIRNQLPH